MIQRRNNASFLLEAFDRLSIRHVRGQHLDCDMAIEPAITRLVHDSHPTGPKASDQLVWAEALAFQISGGRVHRCR
jgi:hypothetical protein